MAQSSQIGSMGLGWAGRTTRRLIEGPVSLLHRSLSLDHNVIAELERRAVSESADYIARAMTTALAILSREGVWDFAIRNARREGLWLEFGVFKGYSINYLARATSNTVYGFDSFQGLQEDWTGVGHKKGTFDLSGRLPRVVRNVKLVPGWFRDTLPRFLAEHADPVSLLHLDCDTYEATAEVLGLVKSRLTPSTVVVLDDYHGFWGYREGQFKAWSEFVQAERLSYRYSAFNRKAVVIEDLRPTTGGSQASSSRTNGS
jgi:predicted O-methyltransferase YrrM